MSILSRYKLTYITLLPVTFVSSCHSMLIHFQKQQQETSAVPMRGVHRSWSMYCMVHSQTKFLTTPLSHATAYMYHTDPSFLSCLLRLSHHTSRYTNTNLDQSATLHFNIPQKPTLPSWSLWHLDFQSSDILTGALFPIISFSNIALTHSFTLGIFLTASIPSQSQIALIPWGKTTPV